jgi:hypothetical protein
MRTRKHKLSIDLNKPAPEEDYGECRAEIWDAPGKIKIKKMQAVIKELKHEKQILELWNAVVDNLFDKILKQFKEKKSFLQI